MSITADRASDAELADDLQDEPEAGPLRRCVVTRASFRRETMLRFVLSPDRVVLPDLAARLPGRGIWLSARLDVLETAMTRGAFAKAARGPVTVPPDLLSGLQAALARRIGDHLGLARRAGQAVCGFQKAREWLVAGRAGLVVEASDGSADEIARFLGGHADAIPVVQPLDGMQLGTIFGRDRVVHVVVGKGRLAENLAIEAGRYAGLTMKSDPPARPRRSRGAGGRDEAPAEAGAQELSGGAGPEVPSGSAGRKGSSGSAG